MDKLLRYIVLSCAHDRIKVVHFIRTDIRQPIGHIESEVAIIIIEISVLSYEHVGGYFGVCRNLAERLDHAGNTSVELLDRWNASTD